MIFSFFFFFFLGSTSFPRTNLPITFQPEISNGDLLRQGPTSFGRMSGCVVSPNSIRNLLFDKFVNYESLRFLGGLHAEIQGELNILISLKTQKM